MYDSIENLIIQMIMGDVRELWEDFLWNSFRKFSGLKEFRENRDPYDILNLQISELFLIETAL